MKWRVRERIAALLILACAALALRPCGLARAQLSEFAVVAKDSIPLRSSPRNNARITRTAYLGEQFRILESRFGWAHLTTEIYRDNHKAAVDSGWVEFSALHMESSQTAYATARVDLSLLEVPAGVFSERVGQDQFLEDPASLPASYYVSANYVPRGFPDVCSGPYSVCAHIYAPPNYFLYAERGRDSVRYERLFNNGTMRPVYHIESRFKLREVRAKLFIVRNIFDKHSCYDATFLRKELVQLADTSYVAGAFKATGHFTIPSSTILKPDGGGETGSVVLTMILDLVPENPGWKSRLVRTIVVWWPACL